MHFPMTSSQESSAPLCRAVCALLYLERKVRVFGVVTKMLDDGCIGSTDTIEW